jgi:hypothetical protein
MLAFIFIAEAAARDEAAEIFAGLNESASTFARDLKLLASIGLARFIVWRELRGRRRRQRAVVDSR